MDNCYPCSVFTFIDKKTVIERRNAVIEEADPRTDSKQIDK